MPTAFVTGGSGFVGGALIRRLAADGWTVRALARSDRSSQAVADAGAEPVRGDLDDIDAMAAGADGADAFHHAAAKVEDLHVHDLRAEFASQLSESKVPVEQVRDARGHRSITMTNTCLRSRASLEDAYRKRTQHQARQRMKIVARG